jgi:two-component system, chemotaxis family, response regulator Rcp1
MNAIEILLVEDNSGDVRLSIEAFKGSNLIHHINVVQDGVEAIAFLRQVERYSDAPRPHVILLDLNLPRKNGMEVLDEIKSDNGLKDIPVVIFTSSDNDVDVLLAYKKQANAYLVKPASLSQFDLVIKAVEELCN